MSDNIGIVLKWIAAIAAVLLNVHIIVIYLQNKDDDKAAIEAWKIRAASMPPPEKPSVETVTTIGTVSTIMHDGHKFVVTTNHKGTQMLHHPACGCEVKP